MKSTVTTALVEMVSLAPTVNIRSISAIQIHATMEQLVTRMEMNTLVTALMDILESNVPTTLIGAANHLVRMELLVLKAETSLVVRVIMDGLANYVTFKWCLVKMRQ